MAVIDGGTPVGREIPPVPVQWTGKKNPRRGSGNMGSGRRIRMPMPKGYKEDAQQVTSRNTPTLHLEGARRRVWVRGS